MHEGGTNHQQTKTFPADLISNRQDVLLVFQVILKTARVTDMSVGRVCHLSATNTIELTFQ